MIYFAQDEATLHIKIGFTDQENADSRLRALQTGNPLPLTLLGTMPGDRDTERKLHQRFASARVAGEWFRPVPSLLQLILNHHASLVNPESSSLPHTLTIYLAGKIKKNCWRHEIVSGLRGALEDHSGVCPDSDCACILAWPILENAIGEAPYGPHHYAGPFFASCDHGCYHGDDAHGLAAQEVSGDHLSASVQVAALCLAALHRANVVFAWIDSLDCYGTIAEIGYANALGKPLWIAGPRIFRDMWFVYECAYRLNLHAQSAQQALRNWLRQH